MGMIIEDGKWVLRETSSSKQYNKELATAGKYLDRNIKVDITAQDGSIAISKEVLNVTPSVTPEATASATGNISLTASETQPSGFYIKATGGNNSTTGTATAGESSTITKTAGWIAAGTSNITTSGTASATASSVDKYYSVPSGVVTSTGNVEVAGSGAINIDSLTLSKNNDTNVSTGTITTTKPLTGFYVAMDGTTAEKSEDIGVSGSGTAEISVTTEGYVTTSTSGTGAVTASGNARVTVNKKDADTTYLPITSGAIAASASITNVSGSGAVDAGDLSISKNSTNTNISTGTETTSKPVSGYYVAIDSKLEENSTSQSISVSGSGTASASVNTAGYVSSETTGTGNATASGNANVTVNGKSATLTYIPVTGGALSASVSGDITANATAASDNMTISSSQPSGTEGTDYFSFTAAPLVSGSVIGSAGVSTEGYVKSETATSTAKSGVVGSTDKKYVAKAAISASGTASASTTVSPGVVTIGAGNEVGGKTKISSIPTTDSTSISKYYIPVKANAAANTTGTTSSITGTASASTTTEGYLKSGSTGTGSVTGTATAKTSERNSSDYYLPVTTGELSASTSGTITANATAASDNMTLLSSAPTTGTEGVDYFSFTATPSASGSITPSAEVDTAGYVSNETATGTEQSASIGNTDKKYIARTEYTNTAKEGVIYTDISETEKAPILISGSYLFISGGYNPPEKISLARLVPQGGSEVLPANSIVQGYAAYDNDGNLVSGTLAENSQTAALVSDSSATSGYSYYRITTSIGHNKDGAKTTDIPVYQGDWTTV